MLGVLCFRPIPKYCYVWYEGISCISQWSDTGPSWPSCLIRDKYHFAIAGSAENHDDNHFGFVVPRKGFIKKVNVRLTPFRILFGNGILFTITINGINVITCFIKDSEDPVDPDKLIFHDVADVKVTTDPIVVNKPVEEGSIANKKSLTTSNWNTPLSSITYLVTILLELDPL